MDGCQRHLNQVKARGEEQRRAIRVTRHSATQESSGLVSIASVAQAIGQCTGKTTLESLSVARDGRWCMFRLLNDII